MDRLTPEPDPRGPTSGRDATWQTWQAVAVGLVLAAGVLVRVAGWNNWSLWLDETIQAEIARRILSEGPGVVLADPAHPPLSYLVTALCLRVSSSDAWLRMPSVLFGLAAAVAVFVESGGRRRFRPAFASMSLFLFLPVTVHYSQEVRPYALALFLVATAEAARRRFAETGKRSAALIYVLSASGALYSLYLAVFPIAVGFLAELAAAARDRERKPSRLSWALASPAAVAALSLPWLAVKWQQDAVPSFSAARLTARLAGEMAVGLAADWRPSLSHAVPAAFVFALAALGLATGRGRRLGILLQLAVCFAGPLVVLVAMGHWWSLRYVCFAAIPLSRAVGEGCAFAVEKTGSRSRFSLAAIVALLLVAESPAIVENAFAGRVDWRRPAAFLEWQREHGRGDPVAAAGCWTWWVLDFQARRLPDPIPVSSFYTAAELRRFVEREGNGWVVRAPRHGCLKADVDDVLGDVRPWAVFDEAEDARVYRFEGGRFVPPLRSPAPPGPPAH